MATQAHEQGWIPLPAQITPLIEGCAGKDLMGDRKEVLSALASHYLTLREKPTRIAFHNVSEILELAREQGFPDRELNKFLAELEHYLRAH